MNGKDLMNRKSLNRSVALTLATLLILTAFAAMPASAQSVPDNSMPADRAWGVSYDWSEYGEDVHTLTGLNIDEILAKFTEAAEEAGFEMLIAQVSTGESMIFIEQSVGVEKTVDDLSGNAHQVTEHITDLTVVNAMLFDMIMLMEWEDTDAGTGPEDDDPTQQGAAIDFSLQMSLDVLLSVNSQYVEYRTTAGNEVVGADMVTTMDSHLGFNMNHDSTWTGGNDAVNVAMGMSNVIGASISDSNVEWRLEQPFDVHDSIDTSVTNKFEWKCNDDIEELTIVDEKEQGEYLGNGEFAESDVVEHRTIHTSCGEMTGNYVSELSYAFSLAGVPADLLGMEVDTFNIDINDAPQYSDQFSTSVYELLGGSEESYITMEDTDNDPSTPDEQVWTTTASDIDLGIWNFNPEKTYDITIDEAGTQVEAMSFLGSPVPMTHLAMNVGLVTNAFKGSEDDPGILEVVGEEIGLIMEELGPEVAGTCDDGMRELSTGQYNDGYKDCMDGSDEVFEHEYDCVYGWDDYIPHEAVNNGVEDCPYGSDESSIYPDEDFKCDNDEMIMLYQVNDGLLDCSDSSDEVGFTKQNSYTCMDGSSSIPVQYVNDGSEQCADGSDEEAELEPTDELMNVLTHIADSNMGETLENFVPELESSMTDGSIEVIEFPFTGADGDLLWYDGAPAGFITFVEENDEMYIFIGPETEGYEYAPSSLGFEYLVGENVGSAIEEVGEINDISDLVEEENDADGDGIPDQLESVADLTIDEAQALASGDNDNDGVSNLNDQCQSTPENSTVGNDGCIEVTGGTTDSNTGGNTDTGTETIPEEVISEADAGMIPSVSFFATLGVLALAGFVTSRRD